MSKTNEYSPPVVKDLGATEPTTPAEDKQMIEVDKPTPYKQPGKTVPVQIGIAGLLNAKATAVTDLLASRVAQHIEYTVGGKGLAGPEERAEEQGGFINTILGSLELDFEKYVVFTDFVLSQLRDNGDAIGSGKLLKHMAGLSSNYDKDKIAKYTTYISFLTRIALNWNIRYKLDSLIDVNLFASNFSPKAASNITQYFKHLQDV